MTSFKYICQLCCIEGEEREGAIKDMQVIGTLERVVRG